MSRDIAHDHAVGANEGVLPDDYSTFQIGMATNPHPGLNVGTSVGGGTDFNPLTKQDAFFDLEGPVQNGISADYYIPAEVDFALQVYFPPEDDVGI